jgi:ubiquinone biosynthesis monooxygenase Coq7
VIDEHYGKQVALLGDDEHELRELCERYRKDEVEHSEEALAHGARRALAFRPLAAVVKAGSRAAIWLAERI